MPILRNKFFLLLISNFLFFSTLSAQIIESSTYRFMLQLILSSSTPHISVKQASIARGFIFADARERREYDVSHIPSAIYVGFKQFTLDSLSSISKDSQIIVYCSVGKRSENITMQLIKAGYLHVFNLYGGIFEWVNEGFPVVDAHNSPTQKVHAYNRLWGRFLNKGEKIYK
jgi:rhodanese-related sulfurtransferase